jgi:hypothetical protein
MTNHIQEYFKSVSEAFRIDNIETSYNAPIMTLMTQFGCNARDLSGGRSGQAGENPDIKIWRGEDEVTETEPFAMIEVLDKWFKSHKGMTMSIADFDHIANGVGLLAETIKIQASLEALHEQGV